MKYYKRLTGEKGSICDAEYCENDNCLSCAATINYDRLADLEDKIESGELCDREEVRKETASDIAEMLRAAKGVVKVHFEAYDELIDNIVEKYGINLEEQQ